MRNLTRSEAHETSPAVDPVSGAIYFASWTDEAMGSVRRMDIAGGGGAGNQAPPVTDIASQYGAVAVSPDGTEVAFVRGTGGLTPGQVAVEPDPVRTGAPGPGR